MQKAIAIIPARYASTRFPGKPLADINGKSMIMRVYDQARKARFIKDVFVATDDQRIYSHVTTSGGKAIMTSPEHLSGTDRCLEAFHSLVRDKICTTDEIIMNIQGDEPFIQPQQIDALANLFTNRHISIATLIKVIRKKEDLDDPNCVKVVIGLKNQALYFSRAAIPFVRTGNDGNMTHVFYKHIGMYAYRSHVLEAISNLKTSSLEQAEKLEQLRWLENGFAIHTEITEHESIAIDSPSDLLKVTNIA